MFTGIVEEIGTVLKVIEGECGKIGIKCNKIIEDINIGDSIAVNGVCLTVTSFEKTTKKSFTADVMAETMRRTNLGMLSTGSKVNLERAMKANGRFGGHIVSGHIDGRGKIESFKAEKNAVWVTISADSSILKYIVEKGSIAIDGISLTVAYVDNNCFKVSLIPHTGEETTLLSKKVGDMVNLENDVISKYVEKLLGFNKEKEEKTSSSISMDFLQKCGF